MIKVLFVCLGNICRSPMAEAVFREMVKERGLTNQIEVASAATSSWEVGNPPHRGTQKILRKYHIPSSGLVSKQVTPADFTKYDYILGMDQQNVNDLLSMCPVDDQKNIHLFLSILPDEVSQEVPDPYYTGDFEQTYDLVKKGCTAWLNKIVQQIH